MWLHPDDLPESSPAGAATVIPPLRDQRQSQVLTAVGVSLLCVAAAHRCGVEYRSQGSLLLPIGVSVLFALAAHRLRAATAFAAVCGGLVCLLLALPEAPLRRASEAMVAHALSPALPPLVVLFVLTSLATRFRRGPKEAAGLAEARRGRHASQIIANLGVAGLCAAAGFHAGALAALAEATADTVSSETGQALGGPTWMLPTLARVAPGTDGGISVRGTVTGLLAAALVVAAGAGGLPSLRWGSIVFLAGTAGFVFDSVLGGTVERRGTLGNDLVNFLSTLLSAALAIAAGSLPAA